MTLCARMQYQELDHNDQLHEHNHRTMLKQRFIKSGPGCCASYLTMHQAHTADVKAGDSAAAYQENHKLLFCRLAWKGDATKMQQLYTHGPKPSFCEHEFSHIQNTWAVNHCVFLPNDRLDISRVLIWLRTKQFFSMQVEYSGSLMSVLLSIWLYVR